MNKKYTLTMEKVEELQSELKRLIEVDRVHNIQAIKDARSQGDLSENADYDAARNEQARINARIAELQEILDNYELLKEDESNLGKWVQVRFEGLEGEDDLVQSYQIVGTLEANPLDKKISNESPLGLAILNKKVGNRVYVKPEEGEEFYVTILKISKEEI